MNFNLKAFIIGFTAALIVYIASIYIWQIGFLAPILGGIMVAYIAALNYRDASINGAVVGSLAALTAIIIAFIGEFIIKSGEQAGISINFFIILGALDVVTGLILGIIGGLIGFYLENRLVS
ncbi:MAG: DUF5518 domain-containing protein [Methanobacterium sp.]